MEGLEKPYVASSYQIGTQAVRVEVFLASGPSFAGEMFLRVGGPHGTRAAETVAERLNDGSPFFPLRPETPPARAEAKAGVTDGGEAEGGGGEGEGAVVLFGKAQVRYVLAPPQEEEVPSERSSIPQLPQLLVRAELDNGEVITGVFLVDLPPGHVRSLDYVNEAGREFVALEQLDCAFLINRRFIRQLRDLAPGAG